jgi:cell division protein FtsN
MDKKRQFLIYDRKEIGVLFLLGITVAVFAFTLGVHLGKRVGGDKKVATETGSGTSTLPVVNDSPSKEEMGETDKKDSVTISQASADDQNLGQVLHDEVVKTGVKMDSPRQVQLPEKTKTTLATATEPTAEAVSEPVARLPFTLQVGSFAELSEARTHLKEYEDAGLKPMIHGAEIKGKGKWYRIYVGEFASKEDAEKAGKIFHSKNLIQSFIVAKRLSSR